jgi:hypothetical protein
MYHLFFDRSKETFSNGIIPAIRLSAHTLSVALLLERLAENVANVLGFRDPNE